MTIYTVIFKPLRNIAARTPEKRIALDLYIGMPITGGTAIQNCLAFNRDQLRDQFKLYPVCGVPANHALVKSIFAKKYPLAHFNAARAEFNPQKYLDDVANTC